MTSHAQARTSKIADIPLRRRFGAIWWIALGVSGALVLLLGYTLASVTIFGVGVWGVNIPFVWGFDLINYAWWIGIANGASLFAAILVLRRHDLRTAVNRFAEGIALFAVICAGIFPIFHLGRPWLFYWTFPYPATFQVWPQFRSTLTWDFWAISTHVVVTSLLWYVGLIPDLATLRDRARKESVQRIYGVLALGWRGSVRHWAYHQRAYRLVAILVLPLILIMQSTVAFEFAVTLVPDWHETRQPLHFVATGLAQGLSIVLLVAVLLRWGLKLGHYIDEGDIDLLGKLVLASALVSGYLYLDEFVSALLSDGLAQEATFNRMTGDYAGLYWTAIVYSVLIPQLLWFKSARQSTIAGVFVGVSIGVGIWFDRFSIIVGGLQTDYLPSIQRTYSPNLAETGLFLGTIGLFSAFILLFARFLPAISMFETRHDEHEEKTS
ncbi:NrfD/PsrC family molybdoenzyme membrane anchor subunit [Microvirga guangxiensis]|uniref:Prokaryotic molybdopterin-containing oxidoreductase family, membrane subunit n=1 Tax=Microvirga guangxiensis TaxID=549386 RepID=A0A1G5EZK8_9HYPH|nr:NrfD/PsrC family molybdoenzyme membrane anchor subunit [Microvirga guangxiensis]SCY32407.1 prokaryotic molybdopterin-containing oxidoreductase family, membrane subunit [Microvirga guangxiensis]